MDLLKLILSLSNTTVSHEYVRYLDSSTVHELVGNGYSVGESVFDDSTYNDEVRSGASRVVSNARSARSTKSSIRDHWIDYSSWPRVGWFKIHAIAARLVHSYVG